MSTWATQRTTHSLQRRRQAFCGDFVEDDDDSKPLPDLPHNASSQQVQILLGRVTSCQGEDVLLNLAPTSWSYCSDVFCSKPSLLLSCPRGRRAHHPGSCPQTVAPLEMQCSEWTGNVQRSLSLPRGRSPREFRCTQRRKGDGNCTSLPKATCRLE